MQYYNCVRLIKKGTTPILRVLTNIDGGLVLTSGEHDFSFYHVCIFQFMSAKMSTFIEIDEVIKLNS